MPLSRFFAAHKRLFIALAILFVYSTAISFATPPSSPYSSGETLDPSCAPGDTNCTVTLSSTLYTDGTTILGAGTIDDPLSAIGLGDGSDTSVLAALVATTTTLPGAPTYSNGTSGVGATLTRSSNGTLGTIDGVSSFSVGDRILVKNQAPTTENGIYELTQVGSASAPYILTRTTDSDEPSELDSQIVSVASGTTNKKKLWAQQTDTPTIGSSAITYSQTTGIYTTQQAVGTQVSGQIPFWTGKARQLSRGESNLFWDNTNNRLGVGTSTPSTALEVSGTITGENLSITGDGTTVSAPTNFTAAINYAEPDGYTADGDTINYRIYAYKTVGSGRIYSSTYATLSSDLTDDNSLNAYSIDLSWDAVSGADGYRILISDAHLYGTGYIYGYDTTGTSLIDDGCDIVCFDGQPSSIRVTPTTSYGNAATINGTLTLSGPVIMQGNTLFLDDAHNFIGGIDAGASLSGGVENNLFGYQAGNALTTGGDNNFFGYQAGLLTDIGGDNNFLGYQTGMANTSGYYNNFIGYQAGKSNTSGGDNNFIGFQAGMSNTTGFSNNFFGEAGKGNTTGSNNNFFGTVAGQGNTTGSSNNYFGNFSGYTSNGSYNNFFGQSSGSQNTTGSENNFIGHSAGQGNTTGSNNVFVGPQAGYSNATGSYNIVIGAFADVPQSVTNISGQLNIGSVIFGTGLHQATFPNGSPEAGGKIGILNNAPAYTLHVGNSSISGIVARFQNSTGTCDINPTTTSLSCSSDQTLKKNIQDLESPTTADTDTLFATMILDKVTNLHPVTYNWNTESDTDPTHAGFIAQEVEAIFPDLVTTDHTTNLKSLNYIGFIPYTVEAIKELNVKISDIENLPGGENNSTFVEKIIAWLGNAENKISRIFTGEICLSEAGEEAECINRAELKALKQKLLEEPTVIVVPPPVQQEQSSDPVSTESDTSQENDAGATEEVPPQETTETTEPVSDTTQETVPPVESTPAPETPTDSSLPEVSN